MKLILLFYIFGIVLCSFTACLSQDESISHAKFDFNIENHLIFVDSSQSMCIVLYKNQRFSAELYYIDDEGGGYSGDWFISNDTLFMISSNVACNIFNPLKISSAELFLFKFQIKEDKLKCISIFNFKEGKFKIIKKKDINDYCPCNNLFKRVDANVVRNTVSYQHFIHFIEVNDKNKIQNTYWSNQDRTIFFKFNAVDIEFVNIKTNQSLNGRYNSIQLDSSINNLYVELIFNYIPTNMNIEKMEVGPIQLLYVILNYDLKNIKIENYKFVDGVIGSEAEYNEWYNFDEIEYMKALDDKIQEDTSFRNLLLNQIDEAEFNKIMNMVK